MTHSGQPTEHTITDHWQTLRKIVLQWLLVISSFGLACLLMFIHVFAPENLDRVFVSYVGLAIVSVGWLMLRAGYERFAVHILIGGVWALFFIAPIIGSGVYTVTYTSHVLVIMLSGVFYTRRVTALITAISVSFGGILVVLADVGTVDTPQNTPLSPLITWVGLSIIFIITASLILAIQGTARGIIGQIERDGRFYRTIISDQTEFIVRWKPDGRRTFVNDAYCRYFGLTPEEAIGTNFINLVAEKDRARVLAKIKRITPENPVEIDQHEVINPDGTPGWQQWTDRGIFDAEGNLIEYQSVGRDITALIELEQNQLDLDMANRREQFLRDFLNMISHDLKTPLTIIENNLYLIRHVSVAPAVERHANRIERQVEHLTIMINDILTIARLENVENLRMESVGLRDILDQSIGSLHDLFESKGITVSINEPLTAIVVRADQKYLKRAFMNLLENAIKYSPQSSSVTISGSSDGEQQATVIITDNGMGISDMDLPHIFERFYRAKDARDMEKNGSGLGLAIVHRVIKLHGGTIAVESHYGKGTTFTVKLPLYREKNEVNASAQAEA